MKRFILILLVFIDTSIIPQLVEAHIHPKIECVLICRSSRSYAYHTYQCRGLAHCTHGISKVSKAEAIKLGYRACRICYN